MQKHKSLLCSAGALLAALSIVPQAVCLQAFAASDQQSFYCDDLNINYQVMNEWDHFQNVSLIVTNPTDEPLYNWAIQYDAGGTISGIWNASVVESSGSSYVISSAPYNSALPPHSSRMFGYTLDFGENETPEAPSEYEWCLSDQPVDAQDFSFTFEPTNQWPDGAAYELRITNNSEQPIVGWKLTLDSSAPVQQVWNADITAAEGSSYQLSCQDWNAYIEPGASVLVGIRASLEPDSELQISDLSMTSSRLDYSLDERLIRLTGFSEFGANILAWEYGADLDYSVYRRFQGVDTLLDTVSGTEFYLDETAESGKRYTYYVTVGEGENTVCSNRVTVETSEALTEIPEEYPDEYPEWAEDLLLLEDDAAALEIGFAKGDSADYVSHNLYLPATCENGSTVRWTSGNPEVIRESGEVIAPYGNSMTSVRLTAEVKKGTFSIVRSFDLEVAPQTVYQTAVQLTLEDIAMLNPDDEPADIVYHETGYVAEIQGNCAAFPVMNAQSAFNALSALQDLLGVDDMSTEIRFDQVQNNLGSNVFYFKQYYQGLPVEGYYVTLTADDTTGTVQWLSSFYKHIEMDSIEPVITAEEAKAAAEAYYDAAAAFAPELIVYCDNNEETFTLAWKTVFGNGDAYICDAATGDVLFKNEAAEATYTGYNNLLKKNITINVKKTSILFGLFKRYRLYDTSRNIRIFNAYNCIDTSEWTEYKRKNNNWSDPSYDSATAASYNLGLTYDFFRAKGRKGYNNANGIMYVGINYADPYTDESGTERRNTKVNNAWSSGGWLAFGSGDGVTRNPYSVAVDVIGHEFTHSVTGDYLNPKYEGESGAMNEAYSDIFGELIDPSHDWMMGKTLFKTTSDTSMIRNIVNPLVKANPNYYKGSYWGNTSLVDRDHDLGYVHKNSTVLSHAAYLMTQDDPAVPDTTQLSGIPLNVLENIWYKSYVCYGKTITFSFHDCRRAVVNAAQILYGKNSDIVAKVKKSFDEVGILETDICVRIVDAATKNPLPQAKLHLPVGGLLGRISIHPNANGEIHFTASTAGNRSYRIECDGYKTLTCTLRFDPAHVYHTVELESDYNRAMEGYVKIADDDNDPSNNLPLTSGTITLRKLSGSDTSLPKTWSDTLDAAGHYRLESLPTGEYDVTISAPGYMTVEQRVRISGTGTTFYNFTVELVPNTMMGVGSASGTVTDAVTGALVPGMTLRIYRGLYIGVEEPAGDPVQTLMTDTTGSYAALALDAGIYTVFVIDNRMGIAADERYLISSFPIKILGNKTIANQNGTVSKSLSDTQLRIVLTWGSEPGDLDSHMFINTESGVNAHTYYYTKFFQQYGEMIVNLDRDCREGSGPETTTIYAPVDGTYTFYVHDFSNRSAGANDTALSLSGAVVTVYSGTSALPLRVYSVPAGYGTTWKVFSYDTATASITDYNTIMETFPA